MTQDVPALSKRRVIERERVDPATFEREILPTYQPVVLRGQVSDWPACSAGRADARTMANYLVQFGGGKPLEVLVAPPEVGGRYFYSDDMAGFNFVRQNVVLSAFVAELVRLAEEEVSAPYALYANAATAPDHLPGWAEENRLDLPATGATPRLWIGNRVQVATHYDNSANLAAVVAGRRRFTLFPPEQVANLYVGPLERTLAGPPVSMVNPEAPDLDRYPRFAEAIEHAQVAELDPGDVLFIPPIWWHHVRSFDALNLLVNYWWTPSQTVSPFPALIHAMLALRDLPAAEKRAWHAWFDHIVFDDAAVTAGDHLPEAARGVLGPSTPERTRNIVAYLINMLKQS